MSKPTYEELEAQVKQLAAENVALKAISDDRRMFIMNGVQLGFIKVPTVETDPALETIRVAVSPQKPTPATDAAIASLRAESIEFAAYHLPSNGKYEDMIMTLADEVREGLTEVKIPAPKYQRSQSEQVKGVQS